jgi:hypothetical protein
MSLSNNEIEMFYNQMKNSVLNDNNGLNDTEITVEDIKKFSDSNSYVEYVNHTVEEVKNISIQRMVVEWLNNCDKNMDNKISLEEFKESMNLRYNQHLRPELLSNPNTLENDVRKL